MSHAGRGLVGRPYVPRLKISHRLFAASLASLNIPERLGGNENRFGCPLVDLAPDGFMKTSSYIWMFALVMLGNVFPREPIGQIVHLNFPRNLGHQVIASPEAAHNVRTSFASLTSECAIGGSRCS